MKKILVLGILVLFVSAVFALESDPSDVVGYVKYECVTTEGTNSNFIALPMDAGFTLASEVGSDIGVCDAVSYWDASNQGWVQATDLGFPLGWVGDFAVAPGAPLMIGITSNVDYYVAGDLPIPASYTLVTTEGTNSNSIMIPLNQTFTLASEVGTDIGVCDAVSYWDAVNQGWTQATDLGFPLGWVGDFGVAIADPLMVGVTAGTTWPLPVRDNNKTPKPINVRK